MKQEITYSPAALLSLSAISLNGIHLLSAILGIKQNTEAALLADQIMLVGARKTHEDAKLELVTRRETLANELDEARVYGTVIRDLLKPRFGARYSNAYQAIGLQGSVEMPRTAEDLGPVLIAIKEFVAGHVEIQNADLNITPAYAQSVIDDLNAANNAVITKETEVKQLIKARDVAALQLRRRLRGLANELEQLLEPMDERWLSFGFNMPGAPSTPDVPTDVVVIILGPTVASMKWGASAGAKYYRVWRKIIGSDTEPVAVGSPADLDFSIENLPAGATIEISISAVSDAGESARSEAVTITMHA